MKNPVGLHWEVEAEAKARFDAMAARANVSAAVFFERLVEHVELDDSGLPVWWSETQRPEELPIDAL